MMLEMLENGYKTPFWSPQLLAAEVGEEGFVCGLQNFIKPYYQLFYNCFTKQNADVLIFAF